MKQQRDNIQLYDQFGCHPSVDVELESTIMAQIEALALGCSTAQNTVVSERIIPSRAAKEPVIEIVSSELPGRTH